jgi:TonB family protein
VKSTLSALLLAAQMAGGPTFVPARVVAATPPTLPIMAIGGGEVWLEVNLDANGGIAGIRPLRITPPYTDLVVNAVKRWRFSSAAVTAAAGPPRPVPSGVLVAGIFRPPALYDGTTAGEAPTSVGSPSPEIPIPARTVTPAYPVQALLDGVVIIEAAVTADGGVTDLKLIRSAGGFDPAALDAARQWTFRPALRDGRPVPAFAYLLFGFRQPTSARGPAGPTL